MIDFPEDEYQIYRFTIRGLAYDVTARDGNFTVMVNYDEEDPAFYEVDDNELYYWIGVVYAYKVTDDTTRNVYSCRDYHNMAAACMYLGCVPDFEELETILAYSPNVGEANVNYWEWTKRADAWKRRQGLHSVVTNSNCEGAD
jgi:hypothetical protein